MPRLKNEQLAIPGGYIFFEPSTKWQPAPFSSLDSITTQLVEHRRGRPDLIARHGWSLDPAVVRQEVVAYNVAHCVRMGWSDYLLGGAEAVPFPSPGLTNNPMRKVRNVAAGVETLVSWRADGAPVVSQELANARAAVCSGGGMGEPCPKNGKGGLEAYFTVPAQNAIRAEVERKKAMKLETPMDENLGVCTACDCPLALKVFLPIEHIASKMGAEAHAQLDPRCWILSEEKALISSKPTPSV